MEAGRRDPKAFFDGKEKIRIVEAIRRAEDGTSGEIRVHIDKAGGKDPLSHAKRVFEKIGMTRTKSRNGVLIYINTSSRSIVIIGDSGIDKVVPEEFWDSLTSKMAQEFKKGDYIKGALETIRKIGDILKEKLPGKPGNINELRDEISY